MRTIYLAGRAAAHLAQPLHVLKAVPDAVRCHYQAGPGVRYPHLHIPKKGLPARPPQRQSESGDCSLPRASGQFSSGVQLCVACTDQGRCTALDIRHAMSAGAGADGVPGICVGRQSRGGRCQNPRCPATDRGLPATPLGGHSLPWLWLARCLQPTFEFSIYRDPVHL